MCQLWVSPSPLTLPQWEMGTGSPPGGALTMVKDLFNSAGAGQDAELFDFATDVDSGQRAEIRIMQGMLEKNSPEENR